MSKIKVIWTTRGIRCRLFWTRQWTLVFHKNCLISRVKDKISASQQGRKSVRLHRINWKCIQWDDNMYVGHISTEQITRVMSPAVNYRSEQTVKQFGAAFWQTSCNTVGYIISSDDTRSSVCTVHCSCNTFFFKLQKRWTYNLPAAIILRRNIIKKNQNPLSLHF